MIQEEKENTEARAEELEYRVSSLDHLVTNHVAVTGSGRSTPRVAGSGGGNSSNHSPVVPPNSASGYNNSNPSNSSSPMANVANATNNAAASPQRDYLQKFHTVLSIDHPDL